MGRLDQVKFTGNDIDRVQNVIVVFGKERIPCFSRIPLYPGKHPDIRIDIHGTRGGNQCFGFSKR